MVITSENMDRFSEEEKAFVISARDFAKEKHGDRKRKFGAGIYFDHPERVASSVYSDGGSIEEVAAAYLHDVPEEEGVRHIEIYLKFGPRVGYLVEGVTPISESGDASRFARKAAERARLLAFAHGDSGVAKLKLADREDNLFGGGFPLEKVGKPDYVKLYFKEARGLLNDLFDLAEATPSSIRLLNGVSDFEARNAKSD